MNTLFLESLDKKTNTIEIIYSHSQRESVEAVDGLLGRMGTYYHQVFNYLPKITVLYLDVADYKETFDFPYGMPFVFPEKDKWIVNMPACEGVVSRSFIEDYKVLEGPVKLSAQEVREKALMFVKLVGFHEIGHVYSNGLGLKDLCSWFDEFMATYFAYGFMKEKAPEFASLWLDMNEVTLKAKRSLTFKTLEAFNENYERLGSEFPRDYTWFQAKFNEKVAEVYDQQGLEFIVKVIEAFKGQPYEQVYFYKALNKIHPSFESWIESFK